MIELLYPPVKKYLNRHGYVFFYNKQNWNIKILFFKINEYFKNIYIIFYLNIR